MLRGKVKPRSRWIGDHLRSVYNTGNILNSIIPVLYTTSTIVYTKLSIVVACIHEYYTMLIIHVSYIEGYFSMKTVRVILTLVKTTWQSLQWLTVHTTRQVAL